ncbi:MAG: PqqD family protein [Acutalibacteraceae bacterium]|nr:PqqD family protein [Acutalibacteraceae bacterium]
MKIKEGFVVREVAGTYLALATGELSKIYNGSITLNSSAKFIFDNMQTETTKEEVVKKMLDYYEDLDENIAMQAVDEFVSRLEEENLID